LTFSIKGIVWRTAGNFACCVLGKGVVG